MLSRRDMLTVSAAGAVMTASAAHAASFGNPDQPPQGAAGSQQDEEAMDILGNVTIGLTADKIVAVTSEMTVGHFVSYMPKVYATPMMILHMEMASGSAIDPHLPQGFVSVGMDVKVRHLAATPVSRTVRAISRVEPWCSRSKHGKATARSVTARIAAASSMWRNSKGGTE